MKVPFTFLPVIAEETEEKNPTHDNRKAVKRWWLRVVLQDVLTYCWLKRACFKQQQLGCQFVQFSTSKTYNYNIKATVLSTWQAQMFSFFSKFIFVIDFKLLLFKFCVSSAHQCSKMEAAATTPGANSNFHSEVTTPGWRHSDTFQTTKTDDRSSKSSWRKALFSSRTRAGCENHSWAVAAESLNSPWPFVSPSAQTDIDTRQLCACVPFFLFCFFFFLKTARRGLKGLKP